MENFQRLFETIGSPRKSSLIWRSMQNTTHNSTVAGFSLSPWHLNHQRYKKKTTSTALIDGQVIAVCTFRFGFISLVQERVSFFTWFILFPRLFCRLDTHVRMNFLQTQLKVQYFQSRFAIENLMQFTFLFFIAGFTPAEKSFYFDQVLTQLF